MGQRLKYCELHLHSMDQFDSDNKPDAVCRRMSELGAAGLALTQHGILAGIEPMRVACEEYGLKFIPGIETYYGEEGDLKKNKHMILLSASFNGYKAIWKAATEGQNKEGFSVMNEEILNKYFAEGTAGHGEVIATSACINGVIAAILRSNETIEHEVQKIRKRYSKYTVDEVLLKSLIKEDTELRALLGNQISLRDRIKKQSEIKLKAREKQLKKMKDEGNLAYDIAYAAYELDLQSIEQAKQDLPKAKADVERVRKLISANNEKLKDAKANVEKQAECESRVRELESGKKSSEELYKLALEETKKMVRIFGEGNFYMEIQNHGIDMEREIYPVLVKIARELNVPLVASNDVHMVDASEDEILKRQILRAMRFEEWEGDQVGDSELYIKTDEEMKIWLSKIFESDVVEEAMANVKVIFDRCNVVFNYEEHYPKYPVPEGKTANGALKDAIRRGAAWRFPDGLDEAHKQRLNYEYSIIKDMGYADYHLIVKDFLEYGRLLGPVPTDRIADAPFEIETLKKWVSENGWEAGFTIGPGRGSAVGSLVCYCLGITNLDPLKYDLLFERFLNPERVSMPDIDSDIAKRIRPKVIEYVQHKYGKDAVCGILTTNAQAPRGAIRIAAKYYGLSCGKENAFLNLGDQMAKLVPTEPGTAFGTEVRKDGTTVYAMLCEKYEDDEDAVNILKWAKTIEGCFTAYGAHAAGIVISDNADVKEYLPLRWNNKLDEWTTQDDMSFIEGKGLVKMDFLGLKTLDIITDCLRMIKAKTGKTIDPLRDIPMDQAEVYKEIFQKGRTNSVFQFESSGMKQMLQRFKPDTFEDLIILVSMFRPGPLQYLDKVIEVKNGREKMEFLTPELEPILGKTYGAIVYQEEVMEIFQKLAGYTLGGADQVRRYMSKKKMDKLQHEKEAFIHGDEARGIKGCVANGIDEESAKALFDQMTEFAKYAFNKSHAAAYAANSYYTGWLKYNYPAEFMAAALNWADSDKVPGLLMEARNFGIEILVPDVNLSEEEFTVTENGAIRFGLGVIKTVGASAKEIIEERNKNGLYYSLNDFFMRCKNVKKNAIENLMKAGAFDEFGDNRMVMAESIDTFKTTLKKIDDKYFKLHQLEEMYAMEEIDEKKQNRLQNAQDAYDAAVSMYESLALPVKEEDSLERIQRERELLGAYVTAHPMDSYRSAEAHGTVSIGNVMEDTNKIVGVITAVDLKKRKSDGKDMAFLQVEDKTGNIQVNVYTRVYAKYGKRLKSGSVFVFAGNMQQEVTEDENGNTQTQNYLNLQNIHEAERKKTFIMFSVKHQASFDKKESVFWNKFKDDDHGYPFCVMETSTGNIRKYESLVSEEVLDLSGMSLRYE